MKTCGLVALNETIKAKLMMRRDKLALWAATLVCVWGLLPSQAHAETDVYGSFELKLGGYYPNIDSEFSNAPGPFETFYGTDWRFQGEFVWNWYLLDTIGKIGVGAHVGYSSATGTVQTTTEGSEGEAPGETSFSIVPFRLSVLYRYDYSAIHHGIPLVPVLKAGLDYYLWSFEDADGKTSSFQGNAGSGGKAGWHASAGLNLLLDVIDPASAAYLDMSWGVNNSYIFAEYMITRIDGFGGDGLDLSDDQWMFGLAFEF